MALGSLRLPTKKNLAAFIAMSGLMALGLELPIAQAAHALMRNHVGLVYLAFHPYTLLVFGVLLMVLNEGKVSFEGTSPLALLGVAALFLGVIASGWANSAEPSLVLRYLWFGPLGILIGLLLFQMLDARHVVSGLLVALSLWACVSLVVYVLDLLEVVDQLGISSADQLVLALRYPASFQTSVWYDDFLGDMNSASNYALLGIVLLGLLITSNVKSWIAFLLYLPLATLMIISFSRGAFIASLSLAIVCMTCAFYHYVFRFDKPDAVRGSRAYLFSLMLLIPLLVSFSAEGFREHWRDTDTITYRVAELRNVSKAPLDAKTVVFGYGLKDHSQESYGSTKSGTHNFFVNIWLNSGLPGLIGIIALMTCGSFYYRRLLRSGVSALHVFGSLGLLAIALLGFRQFELTNLNVTSMAAVMLGVFVAMASSTTQERQIEERKKQRAAASEPQLHHVMT